MRVFIAADLPENLMDALAETQAELRESVNGRYCAPDSFHVTLAFLGNVPAQRLPQIEQCLRDGCARHRAFEARLGELGFFGKRADATLWQGFADPRPFNDLARDVRAELEAAGISFDTKKPKAHITLMRRANLEQGTLPMPQVERGVVSSATVFQSELTPEGAIYTPLFTCDLQA